MPLRLPPSTWLLLALTAAWVGACAGQPRAPLVGFPIAVPPPAPAPAPEPPRGERPCVALDAPAIEAAAIEDLVETFLARREMRCPTRVLTVTTDPPSARVSLDGRDLGTTPLSIEVQDGRLPLFLFELDGHHGVAAEAPELGDALQVRLRPIPREAIHIPLDPPAPVWGCQLP